MTVYDDQDTGRIKSTQDLEDRLHKGIPRPRTSSENTGSKSDTESDDPKGLSENELNDREEAASTDKSNKDDENKAGKNPVSKEPAAKQIADNFVKKPLGKPMAGPTNKVGLLAGASGAILLVIGILVLVSFLGQLKTVHFETVMRSAAFAQFQRTLGKVYGQMLFDAATLTSDSTGKIVLEERSLIDKLRGVNPEKRLAELGREGTLRFDIESTKRWGGLQTKNTFRGVEIDGKAYDLNQYAQDAFGKDYNDLSVRQRWTVESKFSGDIRLGLAERLSVENLSYRSSVYNGVRQVAGISMTKWANKAKDYAGKNPQDAAKANIDETVKTVTGGDLRAKTGAASVSDEEIKAHQEEVKTAAAEGRPTSSVVPKAKLMDKIKLMNDFSDAAFLLTLACIANDINNSVIETTRQNQTNALSLGHNTLTAADQTRVGETVSEAANAENVRWNGADNAALYRQDTGQELSAADMGQIAAMPTILPSPTLQRITQAADFITDQAFTGNVGLFLNLIGLGGIVDKQKTVACSVILNEGVQGGIMVGEIAAALFTLGGTKAASEAAVQALKLTVKGVAGYGMATLLGMQLDNLLKQYAGLDYAGAATGTDNYNQTRMGMGYLADVGNRQVTYGRPMSEAEYSQSQQVAMAELRNSYRNKSVPERYFAISNPFSLAGLAVAKVPTSATEATASMTHFISNAASSLLSPLKLTSTLGKLFTGKASAAPPLVSGPTVGLQDNGWTEQELATIENDDEFRSERLEAYMSTNMERLDLQYQPCYTYVLQSERPAECTADFLGTREALLWRWYNALLYQANEAGKSMEQIASEVPAAQITEPSGSSAIAKFSSTDTMMCPTGTKPVGVVNSRYRDDTHTDTPGALKLKLCQLSSIDGKGDGPDGNTLSGGAVLNALVADRFQRMGEAYRTEKGSKLVARSSFRLEDSCGGEGDGVGCARAGASPHQLGVAIDFTIPGEVDKNAKTCISRSTSPDNPVWVWLSENARKYGIKQYSAEVWHWDVMAMSNRC